MTVEVVDRELILEKFRGVAVLVTLSEEVEWNLDLDSTRHFVISTITPLDTAIEIIDQDEEFSDRTVDHLMSDNIPETYIFPADEEGNVLGWTELPGSARREVHRHEVLKRFLSFVNEHGAAYREAASE